MSERFSLFGFNLLYPRIIKARSVPRRPDEAKPLSRCFITLYGTKPSPEKPNFLGLITHYSSVLTRNARFPDGSIALETGQPADGYKRRRAIEAHHFVVGLYPLCMIVVCATSTNRVVNARG